MNPLSPPYVAVKAFVPAVVEVITQLPIPSPSDALQLGPVPSVTVTIPEGIATLPVCPTTLKLTVYGWPTPVADGTWLMIATVVLALFTFCVALTELLPLKRLSPL